MQAMDKSLNTLTPLCDFVARINNEGHEPTLVAFETVDTKGNWRVISDRFARRGCLKDLERWSTKRPNDFKPETLQWFSMVHWLLNG